MTTEQLTELDELLKEGQRMADRLIAMRDEFSWDRGEPPKREWFTLDSGHRRVTHALSELKLLRIQSTRH